MVKSEVILIALYNQDSIPIRILHSTLEKAGFKVKSLFFKDRNLDNTMNLPSKEDINTIANFVKINNPLFVGISVNSTFFKLASKITKRIKEDSDTFVVWGGIHPTIQPDQSIEIADIVCVGEGAEAIVELARKLSIKEPIKDIPNLWIKDENEIVKNDLRPLIQDLDSEAFPDYSLKNKYFTDGNKIIPASSRKKCYYPIMTSRLCFFNCTYCCNSILKKQYKNKGQFVRRRSVENVIAELVHMKKKFKNLGYIQFWDDIFAFDINWIRKFSILYKKEVDLPFSCFIYPGHSNDEIIGLLKNAGITLGHIGIQSGSERIRKDYFKRNETNKDIINLSKILRKYGIGCSCLIILDNPLETEKDMEEAFSLFMDLPKPFFLSTFSLNHFPGTDLTNILLDKKLISKNDVEDQKQKGFSQWMPAFDLRRDDRNIFNDIIYHMAGRSYIPNWILRFMNNSKFLRSNPKLLAHISRFFLKDQYKLQS